MGKIYVRSPYFVKITNTNLTSAKIEIIIYSGAANTTWQGSPQYTLTSTAISEKVIFEIAELIKDYIDPLFDGNFPSSPVTATEATTIFVDYRVTEFISENEEPPNTPVYGERAFYGYGYFEEGASPQNGSSVMDLQSNSTILKNKNATVTIPIDSTTVTQLIYKNQGATISTYTVPATPNIQDQIIYVTNTGNYDVDSAEITDGVKTQTITIDSYEKCKYTPYKLVFINKFGAYQEIWMFANSKLSMNTSEEQYKSNILSDGVYTVNNPQIKLLTKNGNQRLTLNSDYYPESYNEIFRQLFLSERVWIEYNGKTTGVNIESKSINYKTSVTDGLINYTIDVSFAFDTINNIR